MLKHGPPLRQAFLDLAQLIAQHQKIISGSKTWAAPANDAGARLCGLSNSGCKVQISRIGGGKAPAARPSLFRYSSRKSMMASIDGRRAFLPLRQIALPMAVELRPQRRRQHKAHRHRFYRRANAHRCYSTPAPRCLLLVLAALLQGGEQRVDIGIHAQLVQLLQALAGHRRKTKASMISSKSRATGSCFSDGLHNRVSARRWRRPRLKTEPARKAHRPQNAHRVFLDSARRGCLSSPAGAP